jgi:L-serine dehydratase
MSFLFGSFSGWKVYCESHGMNLHESVLKYEISQKDISEQEIWDGLSKAYAVMKEAVDTGLKSDMTSRSGMINNGAKKYIIIHLRYYQWSFRG